MSDDRAICRTPTAGKAPTRIPRWKYEAVARAIGEVVPAAGQGVLFKDLPGLVAERLEAEELARLGSVAWHVTTVKLEMEVAGALRRVPGRGPQRLVRVEATDVDEGESDSPAGRRGRGGGSW